MSIMKLFEQKHKVRSVEELDKEIVRMQKETEYFYYLAIRNESKRRAESE